MVDLPSSVPSDHPMLLGEDWRTHPQGKRTRNLINCIKETILEERIKVYGVTGASGSGKDSFVDAIPFAGHYRFGDTMKDLAYRFGMVPYDREYYEKHRHARFAEMRNGKTPLQAWIALDELRDWNPFVFVEATLLNLHWDLTEGTRYEENKLTHLFFSGMRSEVGLRVVEELANHGIFRIVRPSHVPSKEATLDALQVAWEPDHLLVNNFNDLGLFKNAAFRAVEQAQCKESK